MEYSDFFYKKLFEIFCNLDPEDVRKLALTHPKIVSCQIMTYDESAEFEKFYNKVGNLESDHATEL